MIWAFIWYYLLGLFTAADIITTKIALASGMFHEANPMMAPVVEYIIEIKIVFLVMIMGVMLVAESKENGSGWLIPAGSACMTFIAVIWNIFQLGFA